MKKRRLAASLALTPIFLLCACGGGTPQLNLSANWYANTSVTDQIDGTYEHLEYKVTFTPGEGSNGFRVSYEDGIYTTTLASESHTFSDDSTKNVYHLITTFNIAGKFTRTADGKTEESERFEDSTYSEVIFRDVSANLQPLWSQKKVVSHLPTTESGKVCEEYSYTYTFDYGEDLSEVKYTYHSGVDDPSEEPAEGEETAPAEGEETAPAEGEETAPAEGDHEETPSIGGGGTYLDNEQIFFALRGLDFSSSALFYSIDPQTRQCVGVSVGQGTRGTSTVDFTMNGEPVKTEIDVWSVSIGYRASQPGENRDLVFAAKPSAENNTYRSVMLRLEYEVFNNLGKMHYTLDNASFTGARG